MSFLCVPSVNVLTNKIKLLKTQVKLSSSSLRGLASFGAHIAAGNVNSLVEWSASSSMTSEASES